MTDNLRPSPSAPPLIIQGAQVLLPSGELAMREIAIADGKITAIGVGFEVASDTQIIDGEGLTVLPGMIDAHVHIKECFTESHACVRGGVTSFLEMPNSPLLTTTQAALDRALHAAAQQSLVHYGFYAAAAIDAAAHPSDLLSLKPTCGVALSLETAAEVEPIFAVGDHLIALHADEQTVETALTLAKTYERRLHLYVSTAQAAARLQREKSAWVSASITLQQLLLDTKADGDAALKKANPAQATMPVGASLGKKRPQENRDWPWQALLDGSIDCIATGHTLPSTAGSSETAIAPPAIAASGSPGVETALPLMLTQVKKGRCTLTQVANWMSTAVASTFNISKKGVIEPGYDADLVLVDLSTYRPVRREELQTQCGWSPFEGWALTGWPVMTIVGGQIAYERGEINSAVRGRALQFDAN